MGAVAGLFGFGSGMPSGTMPTSPFTDPNQLANTYKVTAVQQDKANQLLQALQGQNGLGDQTSVYGQQQNLATQMAGANGVGNQMTAAQGFQSIANGTGPNVAQTALNQNTQQNLNNQATLMASQRGASSNVGQIAREAAQVGAQAQQQAVGQAANLQAQQQQAALSNLATVGGQQVGQQQLQQQLMGGMANQMAGQQIGQTNANVANQMQYQQQMLAALGQYNATNAQVGMNSANNSQGFMSNLIGGGLNAMGGIGSMIAKPFMAAGGGQVPGAHPGQPMSRLGQRLMAKGGTAHQNLRSGGVAVAKSSSQKAVKRGNSYSNDKIPALLSEGEVVIPRSVMQSADPVRGSAEFVQAVLAKRRVR
jgi:hypothetical protein